MGMKCWISGISYGYLAIVRLFLAVIRYILVLAHRGRRFVVGVVCSEPAMKEKKKQRLVIYIYKCII